MHHRVLPRETTARARADGTLRKSGRLNRIFGEFAPSAIERCPGVPMYHVHASPKWIVFENPLSYVIYYVTEIDPHPVDSTGFLGRGRVRTYSAIDLHMLRVAVSRSHSQRKPRKETAGRTINGSARTGVRPHSSRCGVGCVLRLRDI